MGVVRMGVNREVQSPFNCFSKMSAQLKTNNIKIFHYIRFGKLIFLSPLTLAIYDKTLIY